MKIISVAVGFISLAKVTNVERFLLHFVICSRCKEIMRKLKFNNSIEGNEIRSPHGTIIRTYYSSYYSSMITVNL